MATGEELRAAMRRFASGVAVVTVDTGSERAGLTVGSLVSLSLDPPLVGVSISRESPFHAWLREAGGFAVNVLSRGQEALARHFARSGMPPVVRWQGVATRPGSRAPLLEGAAAWLQCAVRAEVDASTHTFFLAGVESVELGPGEGALSYLESRIVAL